MATRLMPCPLERMVRSSTVTIQQYEYRLLGPEEHRLFLERHPGFPVLQDRRGNLVDLSQVVRDGDERRFLIRRAL